MAICHQIFCLALPHGSYGNSPSAILALPHDSYGNLPLAILGKSHAAWGSPISGWDLPPYSKMDHGGPGLEGLLAPSSILI